MATSARELGDEYGTLSIDGHPVPFHRASWLIHKGPIPDGLLVCHKCDVRPCGNPDHLFLGTHGDNTRDSVAKGRWHQVPPSSAKVTPEIALEVVRLAAAGELGEQIAARFGVSTKTIYAINGGEAWSEVTGIRCTRRGSPELVEFGGQRRTLNSWANSLGMHRNSLVFRLNAGWPIADALTTPKGQPRP